MKLFARVLAVAIILISTSAIAGPLDGVYQFSGRVKDGAPDMQGWWGTMVINNGMTRIYHSPDAKEMKWYIGDLKQNGDLYSTTFTMAYKPEYVGNTHKNKLTLSGNTLTMQSEDGKFKETWTKK